MDQSYQPSPYFIRRTVGVEKDAVESPRLSLAQETINPLWEYWTMIKRHRWLIGTCTAAIFLCSAYYAYTRIPLYTATATLLIERKAPQFLKVQDARTDLVDSDNEFLKTQYEILKSEDFAERVVRDDGLDRDPSFVGAKDSKGQKPGFVGRTWDGIKTWAAGLYPDESKTAAEPAKVKDATAIDQGVVGAYLSGLEVRPMGGTSLVQIKFTTPDPTLSARLANAHVSSYVKYGIGLRSQTNDEATVFLQQKLTELKERVEQSEAALNSYRRDKGIISVDDKDNIVLDRLLALNKDVTAAEAARIALEAQIRTVRGRNYDVLPSTLSNPAATALKTELGRLEVEYASLSNEFKAGYPPLDSLKARIDETRRRLQAEAQNELKGIEVAYSAALAREVQLRAAMDEQKKSTLNLKDSAVQYGILAREVDTNRQLYDGVLQRLKEIGVAADLRTSNIYIMGKAKPPLWPSYPDKSRSLKFGLFLGLAVGLGLALLLERLDNTFKSPEETERYIRLPTLAMVPDFSLLNGKSDGYLARLVNSAKSELPLNGSNGSKESEIQLVLDHHPMSLITEAYRALRSSLLLSQAGGPPQTVLMTSGGRGEGKTTTIVNMAIVFAQMGIRVLVIDADLRRPCCHNWLKVENDVGLAEVLAGQLEWREVIKPTATENLSLISSGAVPPNPAELLGSKNMHGLLQQLREHYEFIFVDSSPVMAVTDAVLLSAMVDGTLIVVGKNTPKPLLRKARVRLDVPHAKILGIVLNRVDIRAAEYRSHYHQYYEYYREDPEPTARAAARYAKKNGKVSPQIVDTQAEIVDPAATQNVSDEVPAALLELAVAKLAEAMGPMASVVLRDHIHEMRESPNSFPRAKFAELIARLSGEISSDSQRLQFQAEMEKQLRKDAKKNGKVSPQIVEAQAEIIEPAAKQNLSDEVSAAFLEQVVAKLAEAMGPMASVVLRDHIHEMRESPNSFPRAKFAELITRVCGEISADTQRLHFQAEMEKQLPMGEYQV